MATKHGKNSWKTLYLEISFLGCKVVVLLAIVLSNEISVKRSFCFSKVPLRLLALRVFL
ncbi:hypothetical protein [Helicobacter pylori]|uniref:hypothetical protein n=1 Tax=Helicobacter pylori TaxID=210 RepID=UPI0015E82034|nr:hypothetical protein [Helicobacter pylori]